jgi:type II secretory pathway component PulJ
VLYDKLWEFAQQVDWRLTTVLSFAVGAVAIAAVLKKNSIAIWRRMRRIETQLGEMKRKINVLEMHESRHLMMELNANSKVGTNPRNTGVEVDVAGLTMSPPTTPAQHDSAGAARLQQ